MSTLTDEEHAILDRICDTPKCYNRPASGYISCIRCLHGSPKRADDEAIALKKKLAKQKKIPRRPSCYR